MARTIRILLLVGVALAIAGVLIWVAEPRRGNRAGAAAFPPPPFEAPPGFIVEQVAGSDLLAYPTYGTFDDRGRLFVSESNGPNSMTTEEMLKDPGHRVRLLQDLDGDGRFDKSTIFADKITFAGGVLWHDNSLYVSAAPDLLRFRDTNDDGVADDREVILTGWTLNVNGAVLDGPFVGPDGWLYIPDARRGYRITTREGTVLEGKGTRIWRCRPDGSGLHWIVAGGFDNPVEVVFTPAGETIGTTTFFTDPKDGQRDALMHWVEGGVYPKPHRVIKDDRLALTGDLMPVMSKFPAVAHAGLLRYRSDAFGAPFTGNLFSAQFNTHRVVRHTLVRDGATYRTTDETWLTATNADVHPTDVIEDADGSLLVIDTGGWFIKGCPLSRVAKPEVRGAIYRIRRADAPRGRAPWGRVAALDRLAPRDLAAQLGDHNPYVQDGAVERLVRAGAASVAPLTAVLQASGRPDLHTRALFALSRVGDGAARAAVRRALESPALDVRVAAARAVGLAKDTAALPRLLQMIGGDDPAARRQAATAIEQIAPPGDQRVVEALVSAAALPGDRFVEHAIVRALITLRHPEPLLRALNGGAPAARRAALIALDQMEGSPLTPAQLTTFLAADTPELRRTALWVASHHPDWSSELVAFVEPRLRDADLTGATRDMIGETLTTACRDARVRSLITARLRDRTTGPATRLLLLETVERCDVTALPAEWIRGVSDALGDPEEAVRVRAIGVARARQLGALIPRLEAIAGSAREPATLRVQALGATIGARPRPSGPAFAFLVAQVAGDADPQLQLGAADVLVAARLDERQLLTLARDAVPRAGWFARARLLEAFHDSASPAVGEALIAALLASAHGLDTFDAAPLEKLLALYPPAIQRSADPLLARLRARRDERVRKLTELEHGLSGGDPRRGRDVFFGPKAGCTRCHAIGAQGQTLGPDLTAVGAVRSRHDLLEAIIFPSASFVRDYEPYRVETAGGAQVGLLRDQRKDFIVLLSAGGTRVTIPRRDITSMNPSKVSLMPEGLDEAMSRAELADLISFLEAQR